MALYDPLGFVLPYVMEARMFFQSFWRRKLPWKASIPEEIKSSWKQWRQQLKNLGTVKIDRCIQEPHREHEVVERHLHIFGDASEVGYGCVAYSAITYENGDKRRTLIMAKGRVAPLRYISIPKLELMATVLAVVIYLLILKAYPDFFDKATLWTDSKVVLAWINANLRCLIVFVGNRVSYIHEETAIDMWRQIPTKQNPEDLASRGCSISQLAGSALWLHGPGFLREDETQMEIDLKPDKKLVLQGVKKKQEYGLANAFFMTNPGKSAGLHDGYKPKEAWLGQAINFSTYTEAIRNCACLHFLSIISSFRLFSSLRVRIR